MAAVADPVAHGEPRERRILLASLAATLVSAGVSVVAGLWIGSKSILFDGVFDIVDAGMTVLAIVTTRLIARGDDRRFQYGYWHLEPMLALVNGIAVALACAYAVLDGVNGLLNGGRAVDFGPGAIVTALSAAWSGAMWLILTRAARGTASQLIAVDARNWATSAMLSGALAVSFVFAGWLEVAGHADWARYIDPAILVLVALALLPLPVATLRRAGADLLQLAPDDLDARIRAAVTAAAAEHGFVDCRSHVAQVGRQRFVDVALLAPAGAAPIAYRDLDRIRERIAAAVGGGGPTLWLNVDVTADPRWL